MSKQNKKTKRNRATGKAELILIPDHEHFGNEEECGTPFSYDMLNYDIYWADGSKIERESESFFKNMLRAMIDLWRIRIVISIDVDKEKERLTFNKVWAEFSKDGFIIFPRDYKEPIGHIWHLFDNIPPYERSVKEWKNIIIENINNNSVLLNNMITEQKKSLSDNENLATKLNAFLLFNKD